VVVTAISENGRCDGAANSHVKATPDTIGVGHGKAGNTGGNTALHKTFGFHIVQSSRRGETARKSSYG
jgi:hypothetical protein